MVMNYSTFVGILQSIDNKMLPISKIARIVDLTYSQVNKQVHYLAVEGFVIGLWEGRCLYVSLTDKGKKTLLALQSVDISKVLN
jgi:predicted transcriptional regulator